MSVGASYGQEVLLEHYRGDLIAPIFEARYPGIRLVPTSFTLNGFIFDPQKRAGRPPLRPIILMVKELIPAFDLPPEGGAGTATREIACPRVPALLWGAYFHQRFPDLIISPHADGRAFCAVGISTQLESAQRLVQKVELAEAQELGN